MRTTVLTQDASQNSKSNALGGHFAAIRFRPFFDINGASHLFQQPTQSGAVPGKFPLVVTPTYNGTKGEAFTVQDGGIKPLARNARGNLPDGIQVLALSNTLGQYLVEMYEAGEDYQAPEAQPFPFTLYQDVTTNAAAPGANSYYCPPGCEWLLFAIKPDGSHAAADVDLYWDVQGTPFHSDKLYDTTADTGAVLVRVPAKEGYFEVIDASGHMVVLSIETIVNL